MSLSSLLLGKEVPIDTELDKLFKSAPACLAPAPSAAGPSNDKPTKKRKHDLSKESISAPASKKSKLKPKAKSLETNEKLPKPPKSLPSADSTKHKGKAKEKEPESEFEDSDDDSDLEKSYLAAKTAATVEPKAEDDDSEDEVADTPPIVHESVSKGPKKFKLSKQKYVPQDETSEQRDRRTVFVGNIPLEVASKRPLTKQLQRHILSFVPTAKVESLRFRSVPFQTPTAKLPEGDADSKSKPLPPKKDPRPHDKERTSIWRSKLDEKDDETVQKDEKKFLNTSQKKKIAFINQEFHPTADSVNAYIVFAHPAKAEDRSSNLPPLPPTLDPYEAARSVAEKCDGTLFMERMIRVDVVGKNDTKLAGADVLNTDPKLSVFVGNLDFASKEEDLRVFLEGILGAERGLPPSEEDGQPKKPATWVTRVRIVRDKDTQLGKGFAYVQFLDRECVDELLGLEEGKLRFAKRKLRIQRCKTVPGTKAVDPAPKPKPTRSAPVPIVIPKGDPGLGQKLAGLSKDERKQAKATDADRLARRLAKKKARMAMGPGVAAGAGTKGKDRERVRKTAGQRKQGAGARESKLKGRVRSTKSAAKKNMKK